MKKLLLSLAAVAAMGFTASATVTLETKDLDKEKIEGTYVEKTYKADETVQAWDHWQPVTKCVLGDYTITFDKAESSTDPAIYNAANDAYQIRGYAKSTFTITAPEGTLMYGINFTCTGNDSKKFTSLGADSGTAVVDAENINAPTWTNPAGVSAVTFTPVATMKITKLEIITEPLQTSVPEDPKEPEEQDPSDPEELVWSSFNDATDIVGTFTPEEPQSETNQYGSAAHYQPLESLKLGGYTFTFVNEGTNAAALYQKMSTSETGNNNVRVYKNDSMTITAPEGQQITGLVFDLTIQSGNMDNCNVELSSGNWKFISNTQATWTGDAVNAVTIKALDKQLRFYNVAFNQTVKQEGPETSSFKLSVNDATEIDGTFVEEVPAVGDAYGAAAHYESLASFVIGNYAFETKGEEGKTAPALYRPMSNSTTGNSNVRLYANSTLDIYAPEGVKMTKVAMDCSNVTDGITFTASAGTATYDANSKFVTWEYADGVEHLQLASTANYRIYSFTITTIGGTGVEDLEEAPVVYVNGNNIIAPEGAEIYSINGLRVSGNEVAGGIYVVRCGNKAVKVLVR